jgi:acyl-CoA thioesterase II
VSIALEVDRLPEALRLPRRAEHLYEGPPEHGADHVRDVVFGGQILAQMIMATALDGGDDKEVKSIHAIFARAGTYAEPLEYAVEWMHTGRTFASDTVTALQAGKVISRGLILLNSDEPDLISHTTVAMPDVPGPDDGAGRPDGRVIPGAEALIVGGVNTWSDDEPVGPAEQFVWTRYPDSVDHPIVNQAIISWATDGYLIGTAMRPYGDYHEGKAHKTISTGVVSHTINFHQRFDASTWLLLANESVWAGRGRTHGRCNIWTQDGRLVATCTQDNIVRGFADQQDHTGDYQRIM